MTTEQILPGVKRIGWLDTRHLPRRVDLTAICGTPIAIFTDIHEIPFFGNPDCRCKRQKSGAGYEETATLKFSATNALPIDKHLGFVIVDVNGNSFLIGSLETPHPIVESERLAGSPSTQEAAGFHYDIKHIALKTLIRCNCDF